MDWVILKGLSVTIVAELEGVSITSTNRPEVSKSSSRLERILPALLLQLEDMDVGFRKPDCSWFIPYNQFVEFDSKGIDAFADIVQWSPLTLELESSRWLGSPDFRYSYRFYRGNLPVQIERRGCFLRLRDDIFRLDVDYFTLVEAIDSFNSASPERRSENALLSFSRIKGIANSIGVKLDRYLHAENVLLPSKLAVDVVPEADGRISLIPRVDGVPQDELMRAFFASDDIEDVYALDTAGGHIRVVFDEAQQEVLRRIQRVRHISGQQKSAVLSNPASVFDGISGHVEFCFGPRVIGVGDFPFSVKPYIDAGSGILDERSLEAAQTDYGLECRYSDGAIERVHFGSRDELLEFRNTVVQSQKDGIASIEFRGKTIPINTTLVSSLDELLALKSDFNKHQPRATPSVKKAAKYVLIYTNESHLDFAGTTLEKEVSDSFALPKSFVKEPKRHQISGYDWLRRIYGRERTGCLLADDMGLGKTLQVLMFVASLIEAQILSNEATPELPPWNPILIISPVILIENGTWQADMHSFFAEEGAIFEPLLPLHGPTLKRYRRREVQGKETTVGEPALQLDELRKFKVILTNYETVVNYQHSFSRVLWTAVITDEAQEFKTPSTKVSHAIKALNARFRIACTGTPVETRLFDIWNLFDFLEPGPLLGSAADFEKTYEPSIQSVDVPRLKERLEFGTIGAHLLRRNKEDVLELPPKHEHYLKSPLSKRQIDWHQDLLSRHSGTSLNKHPFAILHHLMRVYQHPALMPSFEPPTPEEAIRMCPKLESVVESLRQIRDESEKVLIFTRSFDMQQLLALTLEHIFGFKIYIVNGTTGKDSRQGIAASRKWIVDSFRQSVGFNILILSPEVAGIGLTITEANHVIHYGRWWNPAKESQATDRVYRIGQHKPVHVYYPISHHPNNEFPTFDEKLDLLITRRKKLAADFLAPAPGEDELQRELLISLDSSGNTPPAKQVLTVTDLASLTWDRFESLVALVEEKRGRQIWLSPKSGDGGIDVISRLGSEVRLVQCKHTQWTNSIERDTVSELISSCDAFRASIDAIGVVFRPVLITNANVSKRVTEFARSRDVEIVSGAELRTYLSSMSCSRAEVENVESHRFSSLGRMKVELSNLLRQRSANA